MQQFCKCCYVVTSQFSQLMTSAFTDSIFYCLFKFLLDCFVVANVVTPTAFDRFRETFIYVRSNKLQHFVLFVSD